MSVGSAFEIEQKRIDVLLGDILQRAGPWILLSENRKKSSEIMDGMINGNRCSTSSMLKFCVVFDHLAKPAGDTGKINVMVVSVWCIAQARNSACIPSIFL